MKKISILLCSALILCSCTSTQFGATATGSALGGMFGSAIGGIFGGHRGSHIGAAMGMILGGVGGAAVTSAKADNDEKNSGSIEEYDEIYGEPTDDVTYRRARKTSPSSRNHWTDIEVENVVFSENNENRALDAGEEVYISFEIYNRGEATLFDVAPLITCDSKYITVSPPATITAIEPGQGIRYRAMVRASSKLKEGKAVFRIIFGNTYVAKAFSIDTHK